MTKGELFKRLHKVDDINTALLCIQMQIDRLEGCLQGHAIRYDQDTSQASLLAALKDRSIVSP